MDKIKVLDLFAGIGGFSMGFKKAGFEIICSFDKWKDACETHKKNHRFPIRNVDISDRASNYWKEWSEANVIIAGPPCQGFSMAGTRDIEDPRNKLFLAVTDATRAINPEIVVIENVKGLLSMENEKGLPVKKYIQEKFESLGYHIHHKVLDASLHNVPQKRERVIFIASKKGLIKFPQPEKKVVTVGNALGNIPEPPLEKANRPETKYQNYLTSESRILTNHEAVNHSKKVVERMSFVPQGGNWKDIPPKVYDVGGKHSNNYRRLHLEEPSITLKHATKSMIIHPTSDRCLTIREVARLQSFPDKFNFYGSKSSIHQQLANAVPPNLGLAIAQTIKEHIQGKKEYKKNFIQANLNKVY